MLTTCFSYPFHFMFFVKEQKAFAWDSDEYRKPSAVADHYTKSISLPIPKENLSDFDGPFLTTSNYFVRK